MKKFLFSAATLLSIAVLGYITWYSWFHQPLNLPYKHPSVQKEPVPDFNCAAPPSPPANLIFSGIYNDDDPERDDTNTEALLQQRLQKADITEFQDSVLHMSNYVFQSGDKEQAKCVITWLSKWAVKNALLGATNQAGIVVRQSTLAALSSAYAQVRDKDNRSTLVEWWLSRVAHQVIKDYPENAPELAKHNNLMYWAAWSVTITGIAVDDRGLYDWGMEHGRRGIMDITPDGTLPLELKRGSKALLYHQHALNPLIMLAEAGLANGTDLYQLNGAALQKLVFRVLNGIYSPDFFTEKSGVQQQRIASINPLHLAWFEVYNARYPDDRAKNLILPYRPMVSDSLGGNMTMLYKP